MDKLVVLLFLYFGSVHCSHFRGGIITYKRNTSSPYAVDFYVRLAFQRSDVYCDDTRIANKQLVSSAYESWSFTRNTTYGSYMTRRMMYIHCSNFYVNENWVEGYNHFTFIGSQYDQWYEMSISGGDWIDAFAFSPSQRNVRLLTRINDLNNSSPVSSIPLTVYVIKDNASVIQIPIHDDDGDIVRCRNASHQECYHGICTYFPYGIIDEGNCTITYDGSGSEGALYPISLKLEDYSPGTTQFNSSRSKTSVDLQFIIRISKATVSVQTSCSYSTINDYSGRFTSPGYPGNYGNGQTCTWTLTSSTRVSLSFESFATESNYDYVRVYDGVSSSSPSLGVLHGYNLPPTITSSSNQLYITFTTDVSRVRTGFSAKYQATDSGCISSPCRNGGTCSVVSHGLLYHCNCPYGYSGKQCETRTGSGCSSSPCRNGGTCSGVSYGSIYYCYCPNGYSGNQCETNLKTRVTCGGDYMEITLQRMYFPNTDYRNLYLKSTSCRATMTQYTIRLRSGLDGCGTTYLETNDTITFLNEVNDDQRYKSGDPSAITRDALIVLPFYCKYARKKLLSTRFKPSTKTIHASEGNFGNFSFSMNLFRSSQYQKPYSPFDYPVEVSLNERLWIQFEVKDTNADLVVFAESCRATTSIDPDSSPKHVLLEQGCVRDPTTMVYSHNPGSKVQRFILKSFRFVHSNKAFVYIHCELMVCHRNSTNSKCSRGCISKRRRRAASQNEDSSRGYDLSAGPLKGEGGTIENDKQANGDAQKADMGMVSGLVVVCGLLAILSAVLVVKKLRVKFSRVTPTNSTPPVAMDVTVNSYEQNVVGLDEQQMEEKI